MKLKDVLKPLGPEVTRHLPRSCGAIEVRVTMPGARDSADIAHASKVAGNEPDSIELHLEIPANSLPVLVPAPPTTFPGWRAWLDKLTGYETE